MGGDATMAGKDYLHKLIDELPESLIAEVVDFTEFVAHKARQANIAAVKAAFDALPEDDEELSEETLRNLAEAEAEAARGDVVTLDDLKRELGLL